MIILSALPYSFFSSLDKFSYPKIRSRNRRKRKKKYVCVRKLKTKQFRIFRTAQNTWHIHSWMPFIVSAARERNGEKKQINNFQWFFLCFHFFVSWNFFFCCRSQLLTFFFDIFVWFSDIGISIGSSLTFFSNYSLSVFFHSVFSFSSVFSLLISLLICFCSFFLFHTN